MLAPALLMVSLLASGADRDRRRSDDHTTDERKDRDDRDDRGGRKRAAERDDVRVLVLDLSGDVDEESRRTITALVAKEIARADLPVVSGDDLRKMIELEGQKQENGCAGDESCLADIAGAMNARLVVSGFVGRLGSLIVVNLSLFDAQSARSHGRATVEAENLEDLPKKLGPAVRELVADFMPKPTVGLGPMVLGAGGVLAGVGVVAGGLAGLFAVQHQQARAALLQTSADFERTQDDQLLVALADGHDSVEGARSLYNDVGVPLVWVAAIAGGAGVAALAGGAVLFAREGSE
jgi:hypothetical protein